MICPYCGNTRFSEPQCILTHEVPEEIVGLVPQIVQCTACEATFSRRVLQDPQAHERQKAMAAA